MRWIKRIVIGLFLAAIVAAIAWTLWPRPAPVEVETVVRAPLLETVDEDGRARVADRHVVTAPLAGSLARIELHAGDAVAEGDVLARIAPVQSPLLDARSRTELSGRLSVARAQKRQAEATVDRARHAAEYAAKELERLRGLAAQRAVPGIELDRAQLLADETTHDLESARFAASVAASEVATTEALLKRIEQGGKADPEVLVRAPVAGQVLRVLAESEGVVATGTPLLEVGDPRRLEVAVEVLTADAVSIHPGAAVRIAAWGGAPLHAVVRRVEPSAFTRMSALGVDEQRVIVLADLTDAPAAWAGLGDGWRVEAQIVTWESPEAVVAPIGSLFRFGDDWAVYVVEKGRAHRRVVELGHRSTSHAEVTAGLAPGDRVILHPGERVSDGARVETR